MAPQIKVKQLRPHAQLPRYMTSGAAGADLFAALAEPLALEPGQRAAIPTGLALEIPPGFEGQVRPRSGLARKQGLTLLNSPGTIDSDYRGEIEVLVINHGQQPCVIRDGDRIAQLVIAPAVRADLSFSEGLSESTRGGGGFGHTGS